MTKKRVATVWLDGCSGCHMSFLDIDHRLLDLADAIDLVYSPLVDFKDFPDDVDVTLVEGAISSEEDLEKIQRIRSKTKVLVSLGDCAVTGNVPSLRNPVGVGPILQRVYLDEHPLGAAPDQVVPKLLPAVRPVHSVVQVDVYVPGCPPSADTIFHVVSELVAGRIPDLTDRTRFGA
ncbi:MAG: NADP oxidoreductase [Chloroflexota bacterium]|nr:MAG: NADP oxidoreductase [Chloroflexota bacterium]